MKQRTGPARLAVLAGTVALLAACGSNDDGDRAAEEPVATETATLSQEVIAAQLDEQFKDFVSACVDSGDFTTVIDDIPCETLWSADQQDLLRVEADTFDPESITYSDRWIKVRQNSDQGVFADWQWEKISEDYPEPNDPGSAGFVPNWEVQDGAAVLTGLEATTH